MSLDFIFNIWREPATASEILLARQDLSSVRLPTQGKIHPQRCFGLIVPCASCITNKKFWEELIACSPLIRHVPHRKRRIQQFFVAAKYLYRVVTEQQIHWLSSDKNGPHRKSCVQQTVTCIRCRGKVFTELLPSNDRRDTQTHRLIGFMTYAGKMDSGAMIHIPDFIKIGSDIQNITGGGGDTQTQIGW
jgi:hypothetical protein